MIGLGASPADVLSITFGGVLGVYATAGSLGLDPSLDDLDMLELVPLVGGDAGTTILTKVGMGPPVPALSRGGIALLSGLVLLSGLMLLAAPRRLRRERAASA